MEILRRSPMLGVLIALIAGLALYDKLGALAFIVGVPVILTGIMFCSYEFDLPDQWQVFIVALIFSLLCSFRIYYVLSRPAPEILHFTDESATVNLVREWGRNYAALIDTDKHGRFVARLQFNEIPEGTRIKFDGYTRNFKSAKSFGEFDEGRYWKARGAASWIQINMNNVETLPAKFSLPRVRNKLSKALSIYMPELTGQYLKAAWLGQHTRELDEKHRRWGTSHLLAVSGFHVAIVILCARYLFGRKNILLLSLILWSYIILTGAAPSAMRAGLMIQTGLFAGVLGRRINGVNSVSVAAVILLLYRPYLFWDIGWRLSVSAALAMTAMPGRNSEWFLEARVTRDKILRSIVLWLIVSPAIFLVTFPQVAHTFKSVPAVGIFLNLFAPFYFSITFMIASVIAALRLIKFPFSQILIEAVDGIFILWEKFADMSANVISYSVRDNAFTLIPVSWFGVGVLILLLCTYMRFSAPRTLILMTCISFVAFMLFL